MSMSMSSCSPFIFTCIRNNSFIEKLYATTLGTFVLALSGSVSIPMYPIPFTFQSCAVLVVGAMLGRKLGLLAILQTIFLGFLGLPVFAGGSNSFVALASPSAGYIYGFFLSVYLAGWTADNGLDRSCSKSLIMFALAHQSIFLVGVSYLSVFLNITLQEAFMLGYVPFIFFDITKFVLAAFIMKKLWFTVPNIHSFTSKNI